MPLGNKDVDGIDGEATAADLGLRQKHPSWASYNNIKRFEWAQETETNLGVEIRCTVCNKVFMKPHRKRKHDASAFERHEETDKHIKAAESLGIDTRRTSAVDMSIQSLVTDVISPPTPDQDHQQPPPITATNAPPLVKKSMSDATWECFLQIALLPSTLLGLGRDGVRKMVARFKMDDHRQSLQALIMLCTPNPDIVPSVVSNRPSHEKFVQLYLQLDDLGLFDE